MDYFADYLQYSAGGEAPVFFHRWSAIAGLGAYLGRSCNIEFGHSFINPNLYVMLMGVSGTRKSTAIKLQAKFLRAAGYTTLAAEKTSKEKFILDLAGEDLFAHGSGKTFHRQNGNDIVDTILEQRSHSSLDDEDSDHEYAQTLIAADEFDLFIGHNNMEFISLLGVLWDYEGTYKNRIKTGKSIELYNPTISILGGTTPTGFAKCFPPEVIGQGFFSRLLLIHSDPTYKTITFPPSPTKEETNELARQLQHIRNACRNTYTFTSTARNLVERIYCSRIGVSDFRFESYNSRRLTHLFKLILISAAAREATEISEADVIYANTILSHTEHLMPRALGEFGKARHSDISHRILQIVEAGAPKGLTMKEIWPHVSHDLEGMQDLAKLLINLVQAEKIQNVHGAGFLPMKKLLVEQSSDTVDPSILTQEERDGL